MNADAFRHFYNYHFSENRKIWRAFVAPLTDEQFTREVPYSIGSVKDQVIHLMSVDDNWFSGLRNVDYPEPLNPDDFKDRESIRAYWDGVEQRMRDYLATLRDDMLFEKPFPDHDEDKNLILWQVLLHVVNHGTDHRAQILRLSNEMGVRTGPQDYIFYVYDNP